MKARRLPNGLTILEHESYDESTCGDRLLQESTVMDRDNATLGSDHLWISRHHHLDREEVAELVKRLQHWLDTGRLAVDEGARTVRRDGPHNGG